MSRPDQSLHEGTEAGEAGDAGSGEAPRTGCGRGEGQSSSASVGSF